MIKKCFICGEKAKNELKNKKGHHFCSDSCVIKYLIRYDSYEEEIYQKILADVDDMLFMMKKTIQKKYKLSWNQARDYTNKSVKQLYAEKL